MGTLPDIYEAKLTPKFKVSSSAVNINNMDKYSNDTELLKLIRNKDDINKRVVVTDAAGLKLGVVKHNGMVYPIDSTGFDLRHQVITEHQDIIKGFIEYIEINYSEFVTMLCEKETLMFMYYDDSSSYHFMSWHLLLYGYYSNQGYKHSYEEMCRFAKARRLSVIPTLNYGLAVDPEFVASQCTLHPANPKDKNTYMLHYEYEGNTVEFDRYIKNY